MRCRRPCATRIRRSDLLGIKWVAGFPENRASGLPAIHAVVVLNDPATGRAAGHPGRRPDHRPADGGGLGRGAVALRPADSSAGRPPRAAIIGAGVQGHSHLEVLGHVLPGVELAIHDRHPDRAERPRRGGPRHARDRGRRHGR